MKDSPQSGTTTIQTVCGSPKVVSVREKTYFEAFKAFFVPRLRKQEEIAIAYEEAVVRKTEAEGEKFIEEAARTSAEKDVANQQALSQFCANVDNIFTPGDSPHATMLKMAKLLESNPEIAAQLDQVNSILDRLASTRGCLIAAQKQDTERE